MPEWWHWLMGKFSTRKCHDSECLEGEFHTAHLTWFGRWRYTGSPFYGD